MIEIPYCRCGKIAEIKSGTIGHSHGGEPTSYWLECPCGMRTKSIAEYYNGTKEQCIKKAFNIWNGPEQPHENDTDDYESIGMKF